jgi:hypothetical protein
MTTTFTLRFEGPPSCADCQRAGIVVCDHIGFNDEAWAGIVGRQVTAPGLDLSPGYVHVLRAFDIVDHRKTVVLTVDTDRPRFHDLARHLSIHGDHRAKASVRAVHHDTGEVLEEGDYDAPLREGQQVCINRDVYQVHRVEHPNRNAAGIAAGVDVQVAHLVPVPTEPVGVVPVEGVPGGAG